MMTKFKIDENLPVEMADMLRQAGYDAATVYDQHLMGAIDTDIANVCQTEKRALVTLDLDFADIRAYPPQNYSGIIVMRLKQQDKPYVLSVTARWLKALPAEPLAERLWIVDDTKIRIRE